MSNDFNTLRRYQRQTILSGIGKQGQYRLSKSKVLVLGCGALGTVVAQHLIRAGASADIDRNEETGGTGGLSKELAGYKPDSSKGEIIIVDRDFIEVSNLQRQILFNEDDIKNNLPKVEAARRKLLRINSAANITAVIEDVNFSNIERIADNCDLIVDGLDNFYTRFLANDYAVKNSIGYIYGGVVGTGGMVMPILPQSQAKDTKWEIDQGATPCLQCIFGSSPPPGTGPTCDTAGVLGPAASVIGSYIAGEAIKFLTGNYSAIRRNMLQLDMWANSIHEVGSQDAMPDTDCPCCGQRKFDYLDGEQGQTAAQLCGRDAVQINGMGKKRGNKKLDFDAIYKRLQPIAKVSVNKFMLRANITDSAKDYELSLFTDGRAIIKGTNELQVAKSLYSRYIGS